MHLITALMKRLETISNLPIVTGNLINALQSLDKKIACQENDILVKIIKLDDDIFSYIFHHGFNNALFTSIFPS